MKRKTIAIFCCVTLLAFCGGCGSQANDQEPILHPENIASAETQNAEAENGTESELPEEDVSETERIQSELASVENSSQEFEKADWGSMGQQDMNQLTAQWYQLWDDELNSLWQRLSEEADEQTKDRTSRQYYRIVGLYNG